MADVVEYLELVVPAYRVAEVVGIVQEELLAMYKEDILEHVSLLRAKLTFEARFLYRYLQAAVVYFGTYRNFCYILGGEALLLVSVLY